MEIIVSFHIIFIKFKLENIELESKVNSFLLIFKKDSFKYISKSLYVCKKLSEKSLIFPVPFTTNLTSDNLYKIFSLLFAQER